MTNLNDPVAIKDLLTLASPLIKALVDTFVNPKLVSFREKFKVEDDFNYLPAENHFTEYFHRTFKKISIVNTLVFNNSQRFLNEIFVPLTIKSTSQELIKVKVDGFPTNISNNYGNILITDTAGMGKSTLMKTIFIDIIKNNIGIPIFIELRRLSREKNLIMEIHEQLNSIEKNIDLNLLLELLSEGGFIIILDGYDEIALSERNEVTKDLQEFISRASSNRFFMTSRPEKVLSSFGNFHEFKIEPLSKKEAFELLRKYDNQGQVSSLLIKKLQEKELDNINEFLTNPLLVSLLFTAFEHKQAIPFKKYLFYRQVYDANFESHDLTKGDSFIHGKYSKLAIDDFHRVLRHIGFECFKIQKIEFTKDELLKLIKESKTFCVGLNFNESDFMVDLLRTVPIFTQDGNYYKWSHKSLQEYFAAQFIYLDSKGKQDLILLKLYNHENLENFINVLDLYYDMDYRTFRNVILFELLKLYDRHQKFSYVFFNVGIKEIELIRRKELMFLNDISLFLAKFDGGSPKFNDLKYKTIMAKLKSDGNKDSILGFSGILYNHKLNSVYVICGHSPRIGILSLLLRKKNPTVKPTNRKGGYDKIILDYEFEKEFEPIKLTDNKLNKFNSSINFKLINEMLEISLINGVTISHENALNELKEIRKNIKAEKKSAFLLKGI